jgi:SAM-dependent methyltransferase
MPAEKFWDERYGESDRIWSGRVNPILEREASRLAPGTALDLGCGEGADAIWLATAGWQVTGVDISRTALDRARVHASAAGVSDRIVWEQHNLASSFPVGSFDLVSAQFLHSPVELPRGEVLRTAAAAVAPGEFRHRDHPVLVRQRKIREHLIRCWQLHIRMGVGAAVRVSGAGRRTEVTDHQQASAGRHGSSRRAQNLPAR